MSILLPVSPQPTDGTTPAYLDYGGILRPILGGALQKLLRLGDRFAIDVVMPPMPTEAVGRVWISRLIQAQRQGAILRWPQLGFVVGNLGSPVVNGANQSGSTLVMRGFAAGYVIREGQFFSVIHGGRRYLIMSTSDVTVPANGVVGLPITPMMRFRASDGAIIEADPKIEGLLEGDSREWTLSAAMTVGLNFRITETK
jgi:hypothetical protein